jgi:ABC-2 type transport system permease protein
MNWEQLRTILWLRWRLTRNRWQRSGPFGAVLAVMVAVGAVMLGGISFVGALLGAALGLGESKPEVVMGVWFGVTAAFLLLWLMGLLTELQRSEMIDLQRLMHLPVGLGQMFVVNYVASHLTFAVILLVPAMTGLALGLIWSRGPAMALLLPLAWSMVLMISASTYCLQGWLATLMTNPRRRRAIIMGITMGILLLSQAPNLYFNLLARQPRGDSSPHATADELQRMHETRRAAEGAQFATLVEAQRYIPPLWLPYGALALARHNPLPAVLGTLGCAGIAGLGLRRAYRGTVRFHRGETGGKAAVPIASPGSPAPRRVTRTERNWLEVRLPAVPEPAAAVALGTLRSMLRAPEVKMAWGTAFALTVLVGAGVLFRTAPELPEGIQPFVVVGAMSFSLLMLVQFFGNQFGYDRHGFRAFVLSPVERRLLLLGKNLATWPIGGSFGLLLLGMLTIWLRLPALVALAALFQLATLLLLTSVAGNILSILVPFRVEPGSMKPTKVPGLVMVVMVLSQLLFPVIMLPVLIPPLLAYVWTFLDGPAWVPVNLLISLLLALLAAFAYRGTLGPLGGLLERRELRILNTVTAELE